MKAVSHRARNYNLLRFVCLFVCLPLSTWGTPAWTWTGLGRGPRWRSRSSSCVSATPPQPPPAPADRTPSGRGSSTPWRRRRSLKNTTRLVEAPVGVHRLRVGFVLDAVQVLVEPVQQEGHELLGVVLGIAGELAGFARHDGLNKWNGRRYS